MAGRSTCLWVACVLVLLFTSWPGTMVVPCRGADLDFNGVDAEEDLPDMNYVKAQAEAGRPRSQTQLADFYLALSDFTNAVVWYQKAADQNHVPAQLSLAGCLLTGRGVARSPGAGSKWLRRAADLIESRGTTNTATAESLVAPLSTNASPRISASQAPAASVVVTPSIPAPASSGQTNQTQVQRIKTLLAAEPDLQESPAVFGPHLDSR